MATLSRDTSEEVERILLEAYRRKTPAERIYLAADTTEFLRQQVWLSIRRDYPHADQNETLCRFAARWLGREWAIRVYGWDPEQHGW